MPTVFRPAGSRGHTSIDWLNSYHSFSFSQYFDPDRVNFSVLRVLNDDRIQPGAGFGRHSHSDMEIISYVLEGALTHEDSTGKTVILPAGGVQRMSAGTGIVHSEANASQTEPAHFLQIWLLPERDGIEPGYEQLETTPDQRLNQFLSVVRSGGDNGGAPGTLHIHQDVSFYVGRLEPAVNVRGRETAELVLFDLPG